MVTNKQLFKKITKISLFVLVGLLCLVLLVVFGLGGYLLILYNLNPKDEYDADSFYSGDSEYSAEIGEYWTLGFDKVVLTPDDVLEKDKYFMAGYGNNVRPEEVFDDIYARTIYVNDNTGRKGATFTAVDAIGLSNKDILRIRARVKQISPEIDLKAINVSSTHNHAGLDTQGLWGEPFKLVSGLNEEFQTYLCEKVAASIVTAVKNAQDGSLEMGYWTEPTQDETSADYDESQVVFNDNRAPIAYDKNLTALRFTPTGEATPSLYIINGGIHPEMMASNNTSVSADFPCYMGKYINEKTDADYIWFTGAIGILINGYGLGAMFDELDTIKQNTSLTAEEKSEKTKEIRKTFTKSYGEKIGKLIVGIDSYENVEPRLNVMIRQINVPVENFILVLAAKKGMINTNLVKNDKDGAKFAIRSEIGMAEFGSKLRIALIPGELAPEFAVGGFLDAKNSGNGYAMDLTPMYETMGTGTHNIVFGLTNDQIGYIIPDNDFMIHKKLPYVNWHKEYYDGVKNEDMFDKSDDKGKYREHYEETVSSGKDTGKLLVAKFAEIVGLFN